jgi:GxxExxY protein
MIASDNSVGALIASDSLSQQVIGEAMYVHRVLGPGFPELVYHNSLLKRLAKVGLDTESEKPISVFFEGDLVGSFIADIIVEGKLLLELKAVAALVNSHEAQLVNYITATRIKVGLLLNFGAKSLEIKRRTLGYLASGVKEDDVPSYSQSS